MKRTILIALSVLLGACDNGNRIDTTPPAAPRGIRTTSLDGEIAISWLANTEPDVDAYNVWSSDSYDGAYEILGTTSGTTFTDLSAVNGVTRYYAVSAFDFSDNESPLSTDVAYDTPRPEGFGVLLSNATLQPLTAGYDFSTYSIGPYDDQFTDFFFEEASGFYFLTVWSDTDIQDLGYTESLDDISFAPTQGWAPSRTVEAIPGHTYVVWTWDDHYAKVRVRSVGTSGVIFDWAFQIAQGNTELRTIPETRPALTRKTPSLQ